MCELHSESFRFSILNIILSDVSKEIEIYLFPSTTLSRHSGSTGCTYIDISWAWEELSFISKLHRVFYRQNISRDHNIHFLDTYTWFSFLGRRFFSSRKFKMAGIDWWSFLFYYFFPSNFFIPFFWHIRACLSSFACQQRPENIFSLKNNFSAMFFTLGNDFTLHVNIRDQPRKNIFIFNKNNIFDCENRK